jgi:hypothetical protein
MASAPIPKQVVQSVYLGNAGSITNAVLFLTINGVTYENGYRVSYGSSGYRNYFPGYDSSTGAVYLYCQAITYGADMPAADLYNIEVYLAS